MGSEFELKFNKINIKEQVCTEKLKVIHSAIISRHVFVCVCVGGGGGGGGEREGSGYK